MKSSKNNNKKLSMSGLMALNNSLLVDMDNLKKAGVSLAKQNALYEDDIAILKEEVERLHNIIYSTKEDLRSAREYIKYLNDKLTKANEKIVKLSRPWYRKLF